MLPGKSGEVTELPGKSGEVTGLHVQPKEVARSPVQPKEVEPTPTHSQPIVINNVTIATGYGGGLPKLTQLSTKYQSFNTIAPTPISLNAMLPFLKKYPHPDSTTLIQGFTSGFRLQFQGPPASYVSPNHLSATQHRAVMKEKIQKELKLGRMIGPFNSPPLPNFRCSAIGLVPKKSDNPDPESTDNWRFIHDLSTYPKIGSVNEWVPDECGNTTLHKEDDKGLYLSLLH